jgi:putative hydrolase of the HAD superfamily
VNKNVWNEFEQGLISTKQIKTERFKRFFEVIEVNNINSIQFSKDYLEFLSQNNYLLPQAKEIVKWAGENFELAIVTNGLASVQNPRFKNSELRKYFQHIIISEEIGFAKPHKKIFNFTFNLFNNPNKNDVIIIGDNLTSDIKGGADFGIDTCWINSSEKINDTNIVPTYQIKELSELKNILA